jgi:hypothetical protein
MYQQLQPTGVVLPRIQLHAVIESCSTPVLVHSTQYLPLPNYTVALTWQQNTVAHYLSATATVDMPGDGMNRSVLHCS